MKYEICEQTLSKARLNKFSQACGQDKSKAIWLYQCNMKLSQRFYGVIGLFEVMLRNAINEHYKRQFGDEDWIVNQCAPGRLLADDQDAIEKAYKDFTGIPSDSALGFIEKPDAIIRRLEDFSLIS